MKALKSFLFVVAGIAAYFVAREIFPMAAELIGRKAAIATTSPITEEAMKTIASLIVAKLVGANKRQTLVGLAVTAITFSIIENVEYAMTAQSVLTFVVRTAICTPLHVGSTVLGAYGVVAHVIFNVLTVVKAPVWVIASTSVVTLSVSVLRARKLA